MEIITHSLDAKKISDAVREVVKTPFQTGNVVGAKCDICDDLMLICAGGRGLHSLDSGELCDWTSVDVPGLKKDTLIVKSTSAEIETEGDLITMNTQTGKIKQEVKELVVKRNAGCGGVTVHQLCLDEGRDSKAVPYCKKYSKELEIKSIRGTINHLLVDERGALETVWALCKEYFRKSNGR